MITVKTPDGGVANFPDGTDPATIKQAMQKKFGSPESSLPGQMPWSAVLPTMGKSLGEDVGAIKQAAVGAYQDPLGTAKALGKGVVNAGDAAGAVLSGIPGELWNNFLDPMHGSAEGDNWTDRFKANYSDMATTRGAANAIGSEIAHPIESLAKRPVGTLFDVVTALTPVKGVSTLKLADKLVPGAEAVAKLQGETSKAYKTLNDAPERYDVAPVKTAVETELGSRDMQLPGPVHKILKDLGNVSGDKTPAELNQLRQYLKDPAAFTKEGKPGDFTPSGGTGSTIAAFDKALESNYPAAAGLMQKALQANTQFKRVETLNDILKKGAYRGAVTGDAPKETLKALSSTLQNKKKLYGLSEDQIKALSETLGEGATTTGLMSRIVQNATQASGGALLPILGYQLGGGVGAALATTPLLAKIYKGTSNYNKANKMRRTLLETINDMAGTAKPRELRVKSPGPLLGEKGRVVPLLRPREEDRR